MHDSVYVCLVSAVISVSVHAQDPHGVHRGQATRTQRQSISESLRPVPLRLHLERRSGESLDVQESVGSQIIRESPAGALQGDGHWV